MVTINESSPNLILDEKKQIIQQTQLLNFVYLIKIRRFGRFR